MDGRKEAVDLAGLREVDLVGNQAVIVQAPMDGRKVDGNQEEVGRCLPGHHLLEVMDLLLGGQKVVVVVVEVVGKPEEVVEVVGNPEEVVADGLKVVGNLFSAD